MTFTVLLKQLMAILTLLTCLCAFDQEGDPVYISTPETSTEEPERSSSRYPAGGNVCCHGYKGIQTFMI